MEERRIWTSTALNEYLTFPYVRQVCRMERKRWDLAGELLSTEVVYGLASCRVERASPERVLAFSRGHWIVENGLHYERDITFDKDRCRIRKHAGARVMAALRNLAISVLRLAGAKNIAQGLRKCARDQRRPLRLLGLAVS